MTYNPLTEYFNTFITPKNSQSESSHQEPVSHRNNSNIINEINTSAELDYITPDTSGCKMIAICENEKKIYMGRYNHAIKKPDWKSYIFEDDIKPQPSENSEMGHIAEALSAVAEQLKSMHIGLETMYGEIQSIKAENTIVEEKTVKKRSVAKQ